MGRSKIASFAAAMIHDVPRLIPMLRVVIRDVLENLGSIDY
jgi:hypothetical protein